MHRPKAFTLVELLVTISLISILTGIAAVSYSGVQARSRDAQRQNDLAQIKIALTTYYNAQVPVLYPVSASTITINSSSDALSTALEPNYIKNVPVDPKNSGSNVYKYLTTNSGANFTLYATFENKNNKKGWAGGTQWVADGYQLTDD